MNDVWISVYLTALQELHLARAEMGKVQEMLETFQEKKEQESTSEEKVGKSIKTSLPALKNIFIPKYSLQRVRKQDML